MRSALAGFAFGVLATVALLLIFHSSQIAPVVDQVSYHFTTCVFAGPDFPTGDLDNGRLLRRSLEPSRTSIRFFDAHFHEVKSARKPGRYGAVVELHFAGALRTYRYITLYRTPAPVRGDAVTIPITAQLPAEFGVDPAVVSAQQPAIGGAIQNMLVNYEEGTSPESFAILLAALSEMSPADPPEFLHAGGDPRNEAWWYALRTKLKLEPKYQDIVDLPDGYGADRARRWPLVLFLHHADASGSDLSLVRHCALMDLIDHGRKEPAIVVAPQRPAGQQWNIPALDHLIDTLSASYHIDPDRVYLTGVSSGGDITWDWGMEHPGRFAALVPMSGESDPRDAFRLRGVPVWGFQGAKDPIVPPRQMQEMTDAVRAAGGHAHLTIIPDAGHDCWTAAYSTDALWTWLFAQKRGQPEVATAGVPSP
jgi:pimeloyl-ACP methyl ester carboxylesterase